MLILVVDDDIISRTVMISLLGRLGYQATAAGSGKEALQLLADSRFDLVLMDCQMPECDGYKTTAMIRSPLSQTCNPDIPVIALTGDSIAGTVERCLASGMNDCLTKPVMPELLQTTIRRWLLKRETTDAL